MTEQEAFRKTYNRMLEEANKACDMAISALEEIQQYQAFGSPEELREAREKQVPKKPTVNKCFYFCPNCGTRRSIKQKHCFCHDCGQAIDWN